VGLPASLFRHNLTPSIFIYASYYVCPKLNLTNFNQIIEKNNNIYNN
jgi:hypothetical protein